MKLATSDEYSLSTNHTNNYHNNDSERGVECLSQENEGLEGWWREMEDTGSRNIAPVKVV